MKIHQLEKILGFTLAVNKRRTIYSSYHALNTSKYKNWTEEEVYTRAFKKNCENIIGVTPIPTGMVGPLKIDNITRYFPIATTEGTLVASLNRGCKLARSGITTVVNDVGITRAPILSFLTINNAANFTEWVLQNKLLIKEWFDSTSKYCTLIDIYPQQCGRDIHLKFRAHSGNAMGMNMVTNGCTFVLKQLEKQFPNMRVLTVSGNFCTDKKTSANNLITGRGKKVIAETVIEPSVVNSVLGCEPAKLEELNIKKNLLGSALAGVLGGYNAHASNVIAGFYAATGQDLGHVGTSSSCITQMFVDDGRLVASVTMPNIEIGIVGGGTGLPVQKSAIEITKVKDACELASLVGGAVLVGELSLLGSLAKGELMNAHQELNRGI